MDAVIFGLSSSATKEDESHSRRSASRQMESFRAAWTRVMDLFDPNAFDEEVDLVEHLVFSLFRIVSILCVIPVWWLLGMCTAGWLWPPQIREFLFVQKGVLKSRAEVEREKTERLETVQRQMEDIRRTMASERANDREEVTRIKADIETTQKEFLADLQQVKELLTSLAS